MNWRRAWHRLFGHPADQMTTTWGCECQSEALSPFNVPWVKGTAEDVDALLRDPGWDQAKADRILEAALKADHDARDDA